MVIRYAEKGDVSQIVDLCRQHAEYERAEYNTNNHEEGLSKAIFGEVSGFKCLVVARENTIVGYATYMRQFSTWDADFYVYLDCLFLTEETRGKGIGRAMMEKIKDYAKSENCTVIQWQTPSFNKKAIGFYQNIGGKHKTKERFVLKLRE